MASPTIIQRFIDEVKDALDAGRELGLTPRQSVEALGDVIEYAENLRDEYADDAARASRPLADSRRTDARWQAAGGAVSRTTSSLVSADAELGRGVRRATGVATRAALTMMRPMMRSPHRAALTEAIAAATARFQADLRRLARTVLRGELARILPTIEPMPTPTVAGRRALHVEPVAGPRRSPVARPRKPAAAAATARSTTVVATSKPTAAARTSKPTPAARTSKPAAARKTPVEPAAAHAERRTAEPAPAVPGTPEKPAVTIAERAAAVAPVELATARPRAELASVAVAESPPALTSAALPWREGARPRREERAQRRQERQERARSRRAAAGMRAESGAFAGARAEPAGAERPEPMTAAVPAEVARTDGTRAVGRRVQRGTVKWFSEDNGYGIIKADDGTDAFVHHSAISGEGVRTLSEGQAVSYEEVEGPKGLLAVNVVPTVPGTAGSTGSAHRAAPRR